MRSLKALLSLQALLLTAAVCAGQTHPSPSSKQPDPAASLQGLDELANQAMKQWKVPGLALAVVKDGKVIYAKGYGYRDVENKLAVTTETLFPIGSITKSFTALAFSILNSKGKVDWDTPVRTYLPEFQMDDPVASDRVTPRDLFSHRTGLPRHDLIWYSSDFTREDMLRRIGFLKSSKDLRSAYQYNNLMIMTMGYLEGKITGLGWEGVIRQKIFAPLGMTHSNLSVKDIETSENHALPYELKKDVLAKIPYHNIDAIGPAGSINSSVDDMSRYLIFHLGKGKYGDAQIVSENNLRMMHTPQTAMPDLPPVFSFKELGHFSYGFGWVVTSYRGHNLVWHNGGIDGFYALLTMLPDDNLGVVILTESPQENRAPEVLAYNVYDRLLGLNQIPWLDRFEGIRQKQKKQEEEGKKKQSTDRKPETHPSHDLIDYIGEYIHPGYGTLKIAQAGNAFELSLNKLGPFPLAHYHYDVFQVPEDLGNPFAGEKVQFHMNLKGDIDRISAVLEPAIGQDIIFTRAPAKLSKDVLQALVGDYSLNEATVSVTLMEISLRLTVPGQPQYELIPTKGLSFDIKGLSGFSLEFKKDASGKITEIVFTQPNGVFIAKKK